MKNEVWQPNLADRYEEVGDGSLIEFLIDNLEEKVRGELSDQDGVYGFLTDDSVVVAKDYVYGDIVSCHVKALDTAIDQGKGLVMFIQKRDQFYGFNPDEIKDAVEFNHRNGQEMANFKINYGTAITPEEI